MATLKGTHITNMDATPPTVVDARLHGGAVKGYRDTFEIGDTDNADITVLFRLPVDAILDELRIRHDALTSGALDFGLYKKNADGTYTAVDDDCFATSYDPSSATSGWVDLTFEVGEANIVDASKSLWEHAGLSTRPAYNDIYLVITHDTGTGADGTVLVDLKLLV